jgi:hypothetical protein
VNLGYSWIPGLDQFQVTRAGRDVTGLQRARLRVGSRIMVWANQLVWREGHTFHET